MNRSGPDPDARLEESLRRIRGALQQNRSQYGAIVEQIMATTGAEVAERVTAKIAESHERRLEKWRRREERRRARQEERRRNDDATGAAGGIVSAAFAVVCAVMAILYPAFFWLIFVGLGFGMSAARAFTRAARERQRERDVEEEPAAEEAEHATTGGRMSETSARQQSAAPATPPDPGPPAAPPDPRVVRIQTLCDKLLAEVESGPPIVREVVTQPQTTIGGLRQACLEIARRERELRDVLAAQDEATLTAERETLAARLANEQDEIVRDRLGQALRALEQQIAHRAELSTAATRLEAENTRILYTLESLHMQLLRARSTDMGAPELGGKLRDSLQELGTEIDAVAEALEWASGPAGSSTPAPPAVPQPTPVATETDAQRAERQAAARRAAAARDAERR